MNILVLVNAFESTNNNNARVRNLCDLLVENGHKVEVFTEPWDDITFPHEYPIREIGELNSNYVTWLLQSIYSIFTNYKERKFALKVMWETRKSKFDAVYCSTNSCFPLCAANIIAKRKHLPLVADISDIAELVPKKEDKYLWLHPFSMLQQYLYKKRRNKAIKKANWVTTVSPDHARIVSAINPNTTLIYNGFNPSRYYQKDVKTDLFRINYIGQLYRSQNAELFMKVINELKDELPKMQVTFYSNHLVYYRINFLRPDVKGLLPEEVIGDTIRQSSMLLLINDTKDNGIQSDTVFKAIGCEKPIIFIPTTEGIIPDIIRLSNVGICAVDTKSLKDYIRTCYQQWEKQGFTRQEVMNKEMFNAQLQAEQVLEKLQQLIR